MIMWNVTQRYEWIELLQRNINFHLLSKSFNESFLVNVMQKLWPSGYWISDMFYHPHRIIKFHPETEQWAESEEHLVSSKVIIILHLTNKLIKINNVNYQTCLLQLKESVDDIL